MNQPLCAYIFPRPLLVEWACATQKVPEAVKVSGVLIKYTIGIILNSGRVKKYRRIIIVTWSDLNSQHALLELP